MFDPKDYQETKPAPRELEPWRKLLLDAAGEIERRGWCQDIQRNSAGRVCLHGALSIARYGRPYQDSDSEMCRAIIAVRAHLGLSLPAPRNTEGLATWNNAPDRTASEVISALRNAALSDGE